VNFTSIKKLKVLGTLIKEFINYIGGNFEGIAFGFVLTEQRV
jgi:hypothetical protein